MGNFFLFVRVMRKKGVGRKVGSRELGVCVINRLGDRFAISYK